MKGYLGELVIDVKIHPVYSTYTPSDWAMLFIEMYGQIDGGHHKQWVLDQVARILKGTEVKVTLARWDNGNEEYRFNLVEEGSPAYADWVIEMLGDIDEDGCHEYGYDKGSPP